MPQSEKIKKALEHLAKNQLEAGECFGGAAAVIIDGNEAVNLFFGNERFSDSSIYRLASVTKLFTAAAVMKLCDEEKIDIHSAAADYIPSFSKITLGGILPNGRICSLGAPSRPFTLFDLLTHTAGLGADELGNREYAIMPMEVKTSLSSVTEYYAEHFHLAFSPGERAAYSGFAGYDVLARIVEIVSGMSFNDYLQKEICRPLGLSDTTFQPTDTQYARLVPMHKRISGEDREVDFHGSLFRGIPSTYEAAGASLISSMKDVLRFCRMLLCLGEGILTEESVRFMLSPALDDGLDGLGAGENNCFGCFAVTGKHRLPRGTVYSHGAYGTHIILQPEKKFAAVLLKNSLYDMSNTSHSTIEFEKALL